MSNPKHFKGDTIIEITLVDRMSDIKIFKGKADTNNLSHMKLLLDTLKERGVYFPE